MTTLPAILAGLTILALLLFRHRVAFPLWLALLGYLVFWVLLPLAYRVAFPVDSIGVDVDRWYPVMAWLQVGSVAIAVLLILALPVHGGRAAKSSGVFGVVINERILRVGLPVLAVLIVAVRAWQFQAAGGSFASVVSLNVSRDRNELGSFTLVTALAGVYLSIGLAVLSLGARVSVSTRLIAWLCLSAVALHGVVLGLRVMLLLPFLGLFLLAGTAEPAHRRKAWLAAWGGAALAVGLVPVTAAVLSATRAYGSAEEGVAGSALELLGQLSATERMHFFAGAANDKFDDITTAANLLALDGPGGGGLRPLTSALLSPIPRMLLPSKPVPISSNGEQSGVPYVRAADRFGAIETGMVVPVSAGAITVWELGWAGLPLFVVANVLLLWCVERWLRTGAIIPMAFAFSVLSFPSFEFTLQAPSSLVRDVLRLGLAWVLLTLIALVVGVPRRQVAPNG